MNTTSMRRHLLLSILFSVLVFRLLDGSQRAWFESNSSELLFSAAAGFLFVILMHVTSLQLHIKRFLVSSLGEEGLLGQQFARWASCPRCITFWVVLTSSFALWSVTLPGYLGAVLVALIFANFFAALQILLFKCC